MQKRVKEPLESRCAIEPVIAAIPPASIKNRSIGPELTTSKTGPIHLSSLVEIAFVD